MLNLCPSYIRDRGETRDTRAHFRSALPGRRIGYRWQSARKIHR